LRRAREWCYAAEVKLAYLSCLALAIPACAHTAPARAPTRVQPSIDLRGLCERTETSSFCTPAAPELPLVDTNFAAPPVAPSPFMG
jgi:hypothetical protein